MTTQFRKIIFIFLLLLINSQLFSANNLMAIMTEEFPNYRRIVINCPSDYMTGNTAFPIITEDSKQGKFSIEFTEIDTQLYFGKSQIRDMGKYPIRIKTLYPNESSISFSFETIPYEKMIAYSVLGSDQYIFDIYKSRPYESMYMEKTIGYGNRYSSSGNGQYVNNSLRREKASGSLMETIKSDKGQKLIFKSMIYSLFIGLVMVILLSIIITVLKKYLKMPKVEEKSELKKPKLNNEKKPEPVPGMVDIAPIMSALDSEKEIRKLMKNKGISYDEASMVLMMQSGRLNVRA